RRMGIRSTRGLTSFWARFFCASRRKTAHNNSKVPIVTGEPFMEASPAAATLPARPADVVARDRFTWISYLLLGYLAYLQSLLARIMPFLRGGLGRSYVEGSVHVSASAIGMVIIGLRGDRLIRRNGFRLALWGGAIGMGVGAIGLSLGNHIALTI